MDNNIALITALFNEKGANFYKDIYFPIIRYSLISLFNEHGRNERYFQILDLQEYIRNKFFIEIPVVVLRNSVVALRGKTQTDIVVETLGAHDDSIYINRIADIQENEEIDREASIIEDNFTLLENLFQQYLITEHLDSNTNLYGFILECEEECYSMIAGEDASQTEGINANFSNTARFIDWLKQNRTDLYQYFTDIVWSAVISAFLRRKQFEFSIKPTDKVSYYLDSALVLALFNLDTEYNVAYAKDVMRNVLSSGGILKVHAMTVREVVRILESVIKDQGPRFGSAIAFGYEENNMSLSDIVNLKISLERKLVSELGIVVEAANLQKLEETERKLENNKNVLYLKDKWGGYSQDKFREKHDIFMCDTVSKMNENAVHPEKMTGFFITLNRDLIELYHKRDGMSSVITPGSVVLKLWIHGAQTSDVRGSVLTEMVSRCMALAQTDARNKIKLFCKYRKTTDMPVEIVRDMYGSLIYRSNNVILKFEELESIDRSDTQDKDASIAALMGGLVEATHEEAEQRHKLFNDSLDSQKLKTNLEKMESSLKALSEAKEESDRVISELQKEKSDNQFLIQQLQLEKEKLNREHKLNEEIEELKSKKALLDMERDNEKKHVISYWVVLFIDIIALLGLVVLIFLLIQRIINQSKITWEVTSIIADLALLVATRSYWLTGRIKYYQCQKEQIVYWEEKHPEYGVLKNDISELERERKVIRFNGV